MIRLLVPTLIVTLSPQGMAMDNLMVAYQWKMLDFNYPTERARQEALASKQFFPEYNVPTGLEVYKDRLFLAIPRLRPGVAASLAFINMTDSPSGSPRLHPYPNWGAHKFKAHDDPPEIVSPFKIRADRCGRLWVLDSGFIDVMESTIRELVPPRLIIYDLNTDQLLRTYNIPDDQMHRNDSGFVNIAVEDEDCQDSFAYLADVYGPGLVVYSYKTQKSWVVRHHYFSISPLAGRMTIKDGSETQVESILTEGVFGLALSAPDTEGFSTLYFHPMTSFDEFAVSTKVLRDEQLATNSTANFHEFKRLGTRGDKGQSGASYLDKKSNVIFFASIHLNAVICWRVTNPNYTTASHSRVFWSNETMIYPSDIKVDTNDTLWVLSNKYPMFENNSLDYSNYNFRILNNKVADAIKQTSCDSKMVVNKTIVNKLKEMVSNKNKPIQSASESSRAYGLSVFLVFVFVSMLR